MSDKLDPYSEGFLRTCYEQGVPEELACKMLIKAATTNARQPGNLPIGDVGRLALFGAGCRVAELVAEKQADDGELKGFAGVSKLPWPTSPPKDMGNRWDTTPAGNGMVSIDDHNTANKDGKNFTQMQLLKKTTPKLSLPTTAQMAASPLPRTA